MSSAELNLAAAPVSRWTRLWRLVLDIVSARRAGSLPLHCLLAWLVAELLSESSLGVVRGLCRIFGIDTASFDSPEPQATLEQLLSAVIRAPLSETLVLAGLLWLLCKASSRPLFVATASGLLWGCLHGAFGLLWFVGVFWCFYVYSCSYLAWRPCGYWRAFCAAAVPHALGNLGVMAQVFLSH